jgi:6-phosphogluconate dehydrogenase
MSTADATMPSMSVGLIGLAVMGRNLALNIDRNGFPLTVFNRTVARTDEFLANEARGTRIRGALTLEDFVALLSRPRRIITMVQAGGGVDAVLENLVPMLDVGDVVMDGGNSHFSDTNRRFDTVGDAGVMFLGTGISGGESGALYGPSIMPGGPTEAYEAMRPILERISAVAGDQPCTAYCGSKSAGHYVKMVHNGIEYGDMQLIAEAYDILVASGMTPVELAETFSEWNEGELESFLIEITSHIFQVRDRQTKGFLVDLILDAAGQKGTGRWMSQDALELGVPIPTIDAAVWSRNISVRKDERVKAADLQSTRLGIESTDQFVSEVRQALYASKICSYAQGMDLLRVASETYGYDIELSEMARIWKGGCIIRAGLLGLIQGAFQDSPDLSNLMVEPSFAAQLGNAHAAWRSVVSRAKAAGIPCPAMSASLDYYDAYHARRLPANLIQAQRDYFGAHTYQRVDREGAFHTRWEDGVKDGEASSDPISQP